MRERPEIEFARRWAPHLVPPVKVPWWKRVDLFKVSVWTITLVLGLAFWIPVTVILWKLALRLMGAM